MNYIHYMNVPIKKAEEPNNGNLVTFVSQHLKLSQFCFWFDGRFLNGIVGGIRTPDPLVPNQMRYQTALLLYEMVAEAWNDPAQEAYETPLAT